MAPLPSPARLDAHQHFWQYDAAQYPWIAPGSPLHRDWLPDDLARLQAECGLAGSIAVQARQTLEETRWLLRLAEDNPRIAGVVGWVDLRSPAAHEQLREFAAHPKFRGVRHVVQDEPDPEFLLGAEFCRGIAELEPLGLTYDLLIYPHQLPAASELVRRFPAQRFVLDHLAKPPIGAGTLEPWRTEICRLAEAPNVWCKLSGMVTEARQGSWQPADFEPYLETTLSTFGIERVMFGSDWPVCLLSASYAEVVSLVASWCAKLSSAEQAALWGGNATNFYGLPSVGFSA